MSVSASVNPFEPIVLDGSLAWMFRDFTPRLGPVTKYDNILHMGYVSSANVCLPMAAGLFIGTVDSLITYL